MVVSLRASTFKGGERRGRREGQKKQTCQLKHPRFFFLKFPPRDGVHLHLVGFGHPAVADGHADNDDGGGGGCDGSDSGWRGLRPRLPRMVGLFLPRQPVRVGRRGGLRPTGGRGGLRTAAGRVGVLRAGELRDHVSAGVTVIIIIRSYTHHRHDHHYIILIVVMIIITSYSSSS